MDKEELLKKITELPKVKTNNLISTMNNISVDDLMSAVDRFDKVPTYNELLKENKKQKEAINKVIKTLEIQIEVIKEQPSNNAVSDNFEINQRNMCIKLLKEVSE